MKKTFLQKGSVITLSVLIFVLATAALGAGIAIPIVAHLQAIRGVLFSQQALYASEAAYEDALWRLKKSMFISSPETVVVGDFIATASISGEAEKEINASSNAGGFSRYISGTTTEIDGVWVMNGWQETVTP